MARGWHYTKLSLSSDLLVSFSGMFFVLLLFLYFFIYFFLFCFTERRSTDPASTCFATYDVLCCPLGDREEFTHRS